MKRIALSLFVSVVMLAMVFSPAFALDWDITPVDQSGYVGGWTSIAVDEDDYGHISYYDFSNWALKYAWYNGSDWSTTTIDDYQGDTIVGEYTCIALSYQGQPLVLYVDISWYDRTQGNLMHCHFPHEDPPGYIGIVDSNNDVGGYTSIALDSDNVPHISYYDFTHTALKHAWLTPMGWTTEVVDNDGDVGKYTSIAIDGSDHLYISYYHDDNHDDLKCAIYNGSQWGLTSVDTQGDVGLWTSIAIDSDDYPHISYYDESNTRLKHAYWDGSSWSIEVVDGPEDTDVGQYTSLALDPTYPAFGISYYDATNEDLKYAASNEYAWMAEVVDSRYNVGQYTSLAFTSSGHPCISYYYVTYRDLKHAEGSPTDLTASPWSGGGGDESARSFCRGQSLPNPFTRRTAISYNLSASALVSLRIYDLTGTLVTTLVGQHQAAGGHSVFWDGRNDQGEDVPAGVYFYRIEARQEHGGQAGGSLFSGKTVLIR